MRDIFENTFVESDTKQLILIHWFLRNEYAKPWNRGSPNPKGMHYTQQNEVENHSKIHKTLIVP